MPIISVRVTSEQYAFLKETSKTNGADVSTLVRDAIFLLIEKSNVNDPNIRLCLLRRIEELEKQMQEISLVLAKTFPLFVIGLFQDNTEFVVDDQVFVADNDYKRHCIEMFVQSLIQLGEEEYFRGIALDKYQFDWQIFKIASSILSKHPKSDTEIAEQYWKVLKELHSKKSELNAKLNS